MNQEEADQDVADEVSEEVDSRGLVLRELRSHEQLACLGLTDICR